MGNLLWMCNIGNLLLAFGLFANHRPLIRASAIWTIPGLAIWGWYVMRGANLSSTMAHVGGIIVGLIALRKVGMDRLTWLYAFVWYLFMQLAARLTTDPALNVNVAHHVQTGWESAFPSFLMFWLVMTVLVAALLWTIGRVLQRYWPADAIRREQRAIEVNDPGPLPADSEPQSASARRS